jgi:D-threo-aldose 1-dehydrogenase
MADPSKKNFISNTGIEVTQLGIGTGPMGNLLSKVKDEDCYSVLNEAILQGINYFDTAPFYGLGLAEKRLGKIFEDNMLNDIIISTKVGRLIRHGERSGTELYDNKKPFFLANEDMTAKFDFSYDGIMKSHEESLNRLNLDYVDKLHIHDPYMHFDEATTTAYNALNKLKKSGQIKAISIGMSDHHMLTRFMDHCEFDCFLFAGNYTLLSHDSILNFMPKCIKAKISIIVGGVYGGGVIADQKNSPTYNYIKATMNILGLLAYNLLHLLRKLYIRGEGVRRSVEWLIRRLIKVGAKFSYHARRWQVQVSSAFPLRHHYLAVIDSG